MHHLILSHKHYLFPVLVQLLFLSHTGTAVRIPPEPIASAFSQSPTSLIP